MKTKSQKQIIIFWKRVRDHLKALKVSQREFANHINVSKRTLEGWIYQNRLPSLEAGFRIAASLDIAMEDLLWGKEEAALSRQLAEAEARKKATKTIDKLIYQLAMQNSTLHGGALLTCTGIRSISSFSNAGELRTGG
ncbi:MAG: helix-turn-helix domain-containing protein [Spirochaetes bacterium]|nr:helix-turn-helix domain-containing protein [Spirochaetota bacterium]